MKKASILSLCLVAALSTFAQKDVVKNAEKAMKSGATLEEVVTIITPAFSDPTTEKSSDVYYIPGKAGFKEFDNLLAQRSLGRLPEDGPVKMADILLKSYDYFTKALPLDSLPDEKGKVKPAHSKDILNVIGGHHNDFNNAGVDYWGAKEFKKAYNAWAIYLDLAKNPTFAKVIPAVPDSVLQDFAYNQALAAWQADELENALNAFRQAKKYGYDKKSLFEYAVAVAVAAKDNDALLEFASEGNKLYGKEDVQFLNQIINYYLQTEKYDEALNYLNNGIAADPGNSQYYALRGIIYDNQQKSDEAKADYEKAIQLNPENGIALFYLGRSIASKGGKLQDDYSGNDYDNYKKTNVDPLYRQAIEYLRKSYDVDPNNHAEVLKVLEVLYYNLNDQEGMDWVANAKLDD